MAWYIKLILVIIPFLMPLLATIIANLVDRISDFRKERLEKSMDLCMKNLEDNSIKVISKGVYGSIYPTADDKFMYILSGSGISKISTANGAKSAITFNGQFEYKPAQEREYILSHIWKQVECTLKKGCTLALLPATE